MDDAPHGVLNKSRRSSYEMYSTITTIPTRTNAAYVPLDQRNGNFNDQIPSKGATNNNKILLIFIMFTMVTLLLITIASLAVSVITYTEQTTVQNQQSEADDLQALLQVNTKINNLISLIRQNTDMEQQSNCGTGLWYRVAHLNMSDPSQQCPNAWREYTNNGIRVCGRPITSTSCATKSYLTSNQYSRVCGRVIGHQFKSPDAFGQYASTQIDFDGINITTGAQHSHIWSYVAGHTQRQQSNCPCASESAASPPQPYIGDHYYCDSGEITNMLSNDPLWDGQHCENNCCTGPPGTKSSPPWFTVELPIPTTDTIEVSICCDQETEDEDTPIELLEIYIQ